MNGHVMLRALAFAGALGAAAGCPDGSGTVLDPPAKLEDCTSSDQCSTGTICAAGVCEAGQCDPVLEADCDSGLDSEFCCKPWENCDSLGFSCVRDESSPIGCRPDEPDCLPCAEDTDCPSAGQFCSGGRCFDTAGRLPCVSSFECPSAERCDRTVFLCVPDRGGCQFCDQLQELCCEEDESCSDQSGFCIDVPESECTTDEQCALGTFCDELERCVQCDADHPCGVGLLCDSGTGDCYSDGLVCDSDEGCPGDTCQCDGNKRCAVALGQCVVPECTADNQCVVGGDSRRRCNPESFKCELPPPVCPVEADEPNGGTTNATPMDANREYDGVLCRADSDVLSFPVTANHRYTATIDFGGSGQAGITVAMLDGDGVIESTNLFAQNDASVQVTGATNETAPDGSFYVRISGTNIDHDQWDYSVTVVEQEASPPADCTPEGQPEEPNNTVAEAAVVNEGATRDFTRCGTGDVDFYRIPVDPLHSVTVTLAGFQNEEGNLNVQLFKGSAPTSEADHGTTVNPVEVVDGPEGETDYYLKVFLATTSGAVENQFYTVTVVSKPRPGFCDVLADCAGLGADACTSNVCMAAGVPVGACVPDANENDGTLALAKPLPVVTAGDGTVSATINDVIRCNQQDADFFSFTMPAGLSGSVLTSFNHNEGDMRLELLETDGTSVDTSNVSNVNSNPDEQVEVPGSATEDVDYIVKVNLASTVSTNITGQKYSISLVTFDNSQCLASEPIGGDDTFNKGRCVGAFTPDPARPCDDVERTSEPLNAGDLAFCGGAPDGTDGCGRLCGNSDIDYYRLGVLNNEQVVRATLDFNPAAGALKLQLDKLTSSGVPQLAQSQSDTNNDGHIDLTFTVSTTTQPREHGLKVFASGTTGHQAQLYALTIDVGDPCFDDENDESGTGGNETPANSTLIRLNPQFGVPYAFDSSAEFTPASSRCANDTDVYEFFAFQDEDLTITLTGPTGLVAALGSRPADLDNPAVLIDDVAAGEAPLVFTNPTARQLYITVKPPTGTVVTGLYTLSVDIAP